MQHTVELKTSHTLRIRKKNGEECLRSNLSSTRCVELGVEQSPGGARAWGAWALPARGADGDGGRRSAAVAARGSYGTAVVLGQQR